MPKFFEKSPLIAAAALGFLLLIPLIILELVNRWEFNERFPFQLFTFIWILQTIFVLLLLPMIKKIQSGKSLVKKPVIFAVQVAGLLLIAYIWGGLIIDQWPCLMGVPNCD